MRSDLPSGTVTFLFTDVEGSTRLLHELGAEAYADALAEHRLLIREACARHDGVEVDTQGDAFFFAFPTAPGAIAAAGEMTEALASGPIQVRIGLHTGTPLLTDQGYVGGDVHRAARIAAAGHGGQVLVSSSTAQLVELALTDLGEQRLKDLSAPERIFQLGDGGFPALKSLYRTNLPVPATAFLGRESELADVLSLLSREDTRLLTLAEASDAFPDGIWWVPLAPLRDPELVLETAAQAVGSKNGLAEHIADKEMLCLFDNFEQVVEAGAGLAELLSACPNLAVLVTSRERLRVRGEQTYPVPPLAEPDGVALFSARARAVDPSFTPTEAVAELCLRLDSLPLALELAAARTALFSPKQLIERLSQRLDLLKGDRDADPRQQTLRATIEWSYDLLSGDEQALFAHLSVFAGGCTYEAAEEIAGADPDTLQSLLDKSLLRKRDSHFGSRFWMLETIREFAAERLEASGETDGVERRRAHHFLTLAHEAEPHLKLDDIEWVDRLDADRDNLRATLDQLEASGETQRALQLTAAMARYWYLRGPWPEGRRRVEAALAADDTPTAARAKALNEAAASAVLNGDYAAARLRVEESLGLHAVHDDSGIAYARFLLGFAAAEEGDFRAARLPLEESLRLFQELGDEHYVGIVTFNLAWALSELGDRERARSLNEESLRHAREVGDKRGIAFTLGSLAADAQREGRFRDALSMLQESLGLRLELLDPVHTTTDLSQIASALAAAGVSETAVRLLACSQKLYEEMGTYVPVYVVKSQEETLDAVRARLDDGAIDRAWQDGRRLTFDEAVALALESPT